jgi:hypothetical protein
LSPGGVGKIVAFWRYLAAGGTALFAQIELYAATEHADVFDTRAAEDNLCEFHLLRAPLVYGLAGQECIRVLRPAV